MNAESATGTVAALFASDVAAEQRSSRWLLLYGSRPRSLLLPNHRFGVQRRCVRAFRSGLAALGGEVALVVQRIAPRRSAPWRFDAPAALQAQWLADMPLPGLTAAAVQVGTPGPFQKATLLLIGDGGKILGVAKVAMGADADVMVERECQWLQHVGAIRTLQMSVPRLLAEGRTGNGRRFLATDLGPTAASGARFGQAPRRFLSELGAATARHQSFEESEARVRLDTSLARLMPRLPQYAARVLRTAAEDCCRRLASWNGPTVLAHGDFVPWNTRRDASGLYVFDWEYAWRGAPPAHDLLHWLLLPKALRGRDLTRSTLQSVWQTLTAYLEHAFPQQPWTPTVRGGLVLQYLLDTVLFYGLADGAINFDHPVNRTYFRILEGSRQWMA